MGQKNALPFSVIKYRGHPVYIISHFIGNVRIFITRASFVTLSIIVANSLKRREEAKLPFDEPFNKTHRRNSSRADLAPPVSAFQVISRIKDENEPRSCSIYLSGAGYRVFDCRESRCPSRSPPTEWLCTTLPQFPVSFYVGGRLAGGREIRWRIGACSGHTHDEKNTRRGEKGEARCKLSSLVIAP